MIENQIF